MEFLVALLRRIGGVLTGSAWFCRLNHNFFLWIYRHRGWRYAYQVSVSLIFTLGTNAVISLHKLPSTRAWGLFTLVVTAVIVCGALIVTSFPLAVIAHGRRSGRKRDRYIASQIADLLGRIENSETGQPAEEAISGLLDDIDGFRGSIFILSPNAVYLLADRWLPFIEPQLGNEQRKRFRAIAEQAPRFRELLVSHDGPLHWVLPDPNDLEVQALLSHRSQSLALDAADLLKANKDALRWLRRELHKKRRRAGQHTRVHLCCFVPRFRVILHERGAHFQKMSQGYGFMAPIHSIGVNSEVLPALAIALSGWCGSL